MAAKGPVQAEKATATRPIIQNRTSVPSGQPWSGSRPVQLGMAVRRKPAIAAATNPKISSWKCQAMGSNAVGSAMAPLSVRIQTAMEKQAQRPAARKKGRKPAESNGHASAERYRGMGISEPAQSRRHPFRVLRGMLPGTVLYPVYPGTYRSANARFWRKADISARRLSPWTRTHIDTMRRIAVIRALRGSVSIACAVSNPQRDTA